MVETLPEHQTGGYKAVVGTDVANGQRWPQAHKMWSQQDVEKNIENWESLVFCNKKGKKRLRLQVLRVKSVKIFLAPIGARIYVVKNKSRDHKDTNSKAAGTKLRL